MRGILAFIVPRRVADHKPTAAGKSRPLRHVGQPAEIVAAATLLPGASHEGQAQRARNAVQQDIIALPQQNGSAILDHNRERLDRR